MKLQLPPHLTAHGLQKALNGFEKVVGKDWLLTTDEDRDTYRDAYAYGSDGTHVPAAAVAPASAEEVQAIVRLANEHKVPLWPVSRGKNLTYGGSAPCMSGSVVMDMSRMKKIIEVDPKLAYCRVEPGVGFYDMHDYLKSNKIPLWLSVPMQAWGSMIGNALERGLGLSAYGEHSQNLCGLEVVLPTGDMVRTGMGAMAGSATMNTFKHGFGPGWEQMFAQSNFGVVTKAGMWLMPAPESTLTFRCSVPAAEDIGPLVETLVPLRQTGIIEQYMSVVSYSLVAASIGLREPFQTDPGPLTEAAIQKIINAYGIGWWNFDIVLYGNRAVNEAKAKVIEAAFAKNGRIRYVKSQWQQGEADANSGEPKPDVSAFGMVNWYGGRGGHIDFSPVMPATGDAAAQHVARAKKRFAEYSHDFVMAFHIGTRSLIGVSPVIFNRDNEDMTRRVTKMFSALIDDAHDHGMGLYRGHIRYMDKIAGTYDAGNHALLRLNERVKDMLDPNGILAPGKSGIWPKVYRDQRQK